jgi:hypothetical protein
MSDEDITTPAPSTTEDAGQTGQPGQGQQSTDDSTSTTDSGSNTATDASSDTSSQQQSQGTQPEDQKDSSIAQETTRPALPENLHYDSDGRIMDAENKEYDANFNLKQEGIYYGPDNKPLDLEANAASIAPDPSKVNPGQTIAVNAPKKEVKFTETRQDQDGKDYEYQYPEIRKDGKLMTHILGYGHNVAQRLVHCLFEDGTTKHVSEDELKTSGIVSPL